MQASKGNIAMWLYDSIDEIDLKINKALQRSKRAIMEPINGDLKEKISINAAGQEAIRADLVAEKIFLDTLISENLHGVLYSEESGVKEFGDPSPSDENSIILLLDPLDGSHNYRKGIPFGCISVAYGSFKTKPKLKDLNKASIMNLYGDGTYFAEIGNGAYFNGQKLSPQIDKINSSDNIQISYYAYGKNASRYFFDFNEVYSLRSLGSAAWELAILTTYQNDAFADIRGVLKAHDFAAARIIIEEVQGAFEMLNSTPYGTLNNIPLDDFRSGYSILSAINLELHQNLREQFLKNGLV